MAITWQGLTTFINNQIAAVQSAVGSAINATAGSVTLALAQANTGVALWLQAQATQILAITRAATSTGSDLDSFMADFGLTRLAAVASKGSATFSRYNSSQQAIVPLGAQISTGPGGTIFQVTEDATNAAWSTALNGYVLPIGTASVTVPIVALVAGTAGNVLPNTIQSFVTPISGVDTVTNSLATAAGVDSESDAAFRVRFVNYLNSLSKGTKSAIASAITAIQANITYSLTENVDINGNVRLGYFYIVIDDGTGSPPTSLLTQVATAVDAVRPVTTVFGVYGPQTITANVVMSITTATGYVHTDVAAKVATTLTKYIDALAVGAPLPWSSLVATAYSVAGVTNVLSTALNGSTADITCTNLQVIKAGTVTVS